MPLGVKPVCSGCKSNNSTMWTKSENGEILCNECLTKPTHGVKETNGNGTSVSKKGVSASESAQERVLRKSSRNKPSKYRVSAKPVTAKGKGRRVIFKKSQPVKAPTAISTIVTGQSIFHDGIYFQIGDIVSLVDDDENLYYAQIRGFLQDQYYEKSAVITWLLPTKQSDRYKFDPATYILGPEEDLPRKMEYMEFVCHAPSDYYQNKTSPYPVEEQSPELCYIWSSLGPEIKPAPTRLDEVFGPGDHVKQDPAPMQIFPQAMKKSKIEKVKIKEEKKFIVVE